MMKELTVLYAEDDVSVLGHTSKTLSYLFKRVLSARDGEEAITLLEKESVDVLITDYVMPKRNGFDVICEAKKRYPHIIVFVTSSYTDTDILLKCIPLGIAEYLVKPISYDRLVRTLETIFVKKQTFIVPFNETVMYHTQQKYLIVGDNHIEMGPHQIKLIEYLLRCKGQVVHKTTLMNYIYGEMVDENLLKNLILRLRKKTGDDLFVTIKNVGYLLK